MSNRTPIYLFSEIENRLKSGEKIPSVSSHTINNRHGCGTHDLITLRINNDDEGKLYIKRLRNDGYVFRTRGRNPNRKQFAGQVHVSYKGSEPNKVSNYSNRLVHRYATNQLRQTIPLRFSTYFVLFPK